MKTNILKNCACLLLIGWLFALMQQVKADIADAGIANEYGDLRSRIVGADISSIFIMAALMNAEKRANQLSESEAREIILAFFDAEKRETITGLKFSLALRKFVMSHWETSYFCLRVRANETYHAIQRNLNNLPEDLQELFKSISEEKFCENVKQLPFFKPAKEVQKTNQEETTETPEVSEENSTEIVSVA